MRYIFFSQDILPWAPFFFKLILPQDNFIFCVVVLIVWLMIVCSCFSARHRREYYVLIRSWRFLFIRFLSIVLTRELDAIFRARRDFIFAHILSDEMIPVWISQSFWHLHSYVMCIAFRVRTIYVYTLVFGSCRPLLALDGTKDSAAHQFPQDVLQ